MAIQFNGSDLPDFHSEVNLKAGLEKLVCSRGFSCGDISYEFVSTDKMNEINVEVLSHNYPTDIITFDETVGSKIFCDIFICPAVVRENALEYDVNFEMELLRVMVHGLLHCMGFNDSNEKERTEMRDAEDESLVFLNVSRETNRFL